MVDVRESNIEKARAFLDEEASVVDAIRRLVLLGGVFPIASLLPSRIKDDYSIELARHVYTQIAEPMFINMFDFLQTRIEEDRGLLDLAAAQIEKESKATVTTNSGVFDFHTERKLRLDHAPLESPKTPYERGMDHYNQRLTSYLMRAEFSRFRREDASRLFLGCLGECSDQVEQALTSQLKMTNWTQLTADLLSEGRAAGSVAALPLKNWADRGEVIIENISDDFRRCVEAVVTYGADEADARRYRWIAAMGRGYKKPFNPHRRNYPMPKGAA